MTPRERQTLIAIERHYALLGRPPVLKELGAALGVTRQQVFALVKGVARCGRCYLHHERGQRTQIRLLQPGAELTTKELIAALTARLAPEGKRLLTLVSDTAIVVPPGRRGCEHEPTDVILPLAA